MNFTGLISRRVLRLILTVLIASSAVFVLLRVMPGDPARVIAGIEGASDPAVLDSIRSSLGLDKPLPVQYVSWLKSVLLLDFGDSYTQSRPVADLIGQRLTTTAVLAFAGMIISLLIALPLGVSSAVHQGRAGDSTIMAASHILLAVPEFWLGILLLLGFSVAIPLFPLFGSDSPLHFVLPSLALGLGRAAFLVRLVRAAVIRELDREYVKFFSRLGVPQRRILWRHIIPNALIPIAIPSAIQFGYLLGGAIIIEQVFGMGGMGRLLMTAVQTRDFPVIQSAVILFAMIFSMVNFLADVLVVIADPRSRI